jgi:hypothetical protein
VRKALGVVHTGLTKTPVRFAVNHLQEGTEEMIHPILIAKLVVRMTKHLVRDRILSFSPFPTSVVQLEAVPAPVERDLTHPYPWDRDEHDERGRPRQRLPEASRSRDLPSTGMKRVEHRQSERIPSRQPEHETKRRTARTRSR